MAADARSHSTTRARDRVDDMFGAARETHETVAPHDAHGAAHASSRTRGSGFSTPLTSERVGNLSSPRARGTMNDGRDGGRTWETYAGAGAGGGGGDRADARPVQKFSSLLFASPHRDATPGGGLYRTESLTGGGGSTPRTSGGTNRYFGGGGPSSGNRGKLEERAAPAPAPAIGGVSSRGTPLFTRTETGGDDHTPGFLRRAIEKTHAENTKGSDARTGEDALNAWLGPSSPAKSSAPSSTNPAFTASVALSDAEAEHWVTVYGFSKDDKSIILQEFQRDGDIVNFGSFHESGRPVNWLHVRFATKESARRALRRNGQNISGIMVGVKELDANSKIDIGSGASGEGRLSRNASVRRVVPIRDGITLQQRQRTTWDKVLQFVFGA